MLTRRSKGGPAKVSIFASALFGSISGSAVANVYSTGTFTIPLMKRVGYTPSFAGAVEAVSSTGGQLMPPIMGATAFVMADVTGAGYLAVAKAALLPSLLYYFSLLMMIHFEAVNKNIGIIPADQIPDPRSVLRRTYHILPIIVLIGLLVSGRSVISSAFISIASVIVVSCFSAETRFTPKSLYHTLELSSRNALMISTCSACAGIIVAIVSITGIGYKFISIITDLGQFHILLLLILLMFTCFVLGTGVPATPAYIIVATLGAPALMKLGIPTLSAHMFVLYYAILSEITPPVCLSAYAGASIAGANAMQTGWRAFRLGIVAYIIPFDLRLPARPAPDGRVLPRRAGPRHIVHRRHHAGGRYAGLSDGPVLPVGTCASARGGHSPALPRNVQRPRRIGRHTLHRYAPVPPPWQGASPTRSQSGLSRPRTAAACLKGVF